MKELTITKEEIELLKEMKDNCLNLSVYDDEKRLLKANTITKFLVEHEENQQLKDQLKQKEDVIDKVIKWIENDYYSMNTTDIDSILVRNNKLVQIRKFLKGDK